MWNFEQEISEYIWKTKYQYHDGGKILEPTIDHTWHRVANAVASCESSKEQPYWQKKFHELLEDFKFLPGGRILAGAGTAHKVTLFNCFVMQIKQDSVSGIFNALREGALTLQQGGGIGYDFSILRPSGYRCKKTHAIASGPVSFMKIWDSMSATMVSSTARRGAMMANLRCDHPDIMEFIKIKSHPSELRHFNLSVIITNEFMDAVVADSDWPLVFPGKNGRTVLRRWSGSPYPINCEIIKVIKARDLWLRIMESAYAYAEPGVIFEDTINNLNPLWYKEWISATNPCGEIPLPYYGACNLGSINLTQFVRHPFTALAKLDWRHLEAVIKVATRFLDNVVEISHYPLKAQKYAALNTRRLGLGFTGLANVFLMLGIPYGSAESLALAKSISQKVAFTTWETSCQLGRDKGSFPLFSQDYLAGQFVLSLPPELQQEIRKYGMRNSHHNAIAPTGSISLLANNVSGGIEPIFASQYERSIRGANKDKIQFRIEDYAFHLWRKEHQGLPPAWKEVKTLAPQDHLAIQGAVQPYIDNAISKTINLPEDYPFNQLPDIYLQAHELGLKGCTIFRPNPITGSVLWTEETDPCCSLPGVR